MLTYSREAWSLHEQSLFIISSPVFIYYAFSRLAKLTDDFLQSFDRLTANSLESCALVWIMLWRSFRTCILSRNSNRYSKIINLIYPSVLYMKAKPTKCICIWTVLVMFLSFFHDGTGNIRCWKVYFVRPNYQLYVKTSDKNAFQHALSVHLQETTLDWLLRLL